MRLASLGAIEGFAADVVVSGINHGSNLGDDITYSGTVAAALEGVVLGLPAIAVSQQSGARAMDYRFDGGFQFELAAGFVARLVAALQEVPLRPGTLLNVNVPAGEPQGVEVTRLGKRIYRDELKLETEEAGPPSRRRYWVYGDDPGFHDLPGTDLAAVAAGRVAVTPIHFDLTDHPGLEALESFDLEALLEQAVMAEHEPRASAVGETTTAVEREPTLAEREPPVVESAPPLADGEPPLAERAGTAVDQEAI